ncbi:hypothetical protein roselon_03398 [Roseibacterium elongatum DSM 19469]|uniref:DUF2155 domain-containing protein n=1 Tax=Roseicyclus elongatus DSM 19469 TaxID=1294273 RepID=W8S9H4_9RHOB|nr:DUF2155 domain-containing protein [Roseibacterium elongatum]AHM05656.1 hypothetical protein roselon_03398 [Roseibacterium elongatum DSM 19469]
MIRLGLVILTLHALVAGGVAAQQFDNFGGGSFDTFLLPDPDAEGVEIEGLDDFGEGGGETGLTLQPLGNPDVTLQEGIDGLPVMETFPGVTGPVTSVSQPATLSATRVRLRALDRMRGDPTDLDLAMGETALFGRIAIRVLDCRYPEGNPSSDAFAHVQVVDTDGQSLFDGWMIASSPALNALEHARYDVWVLSCITS